MLDGEFRDQVRAGDGRLLADSGWRSNTIALTAWPLVAGLLRNDPRLRGVQFCAVGEGSAAWDAAQPRADPSTTTLFHEVDRIAIAPERVTYLDGFGNATDSPTSRVEAVAVFSWPSPQTLREFGLFGGDAGLSLNSGRLINYVIHEVTTVPAGATLTRRVRLSLRPAVSGTRFESLEVPRHSIGTLPAEALDGVGRQIGAALEEAGATTVQAVAQLAPGAAVRGLSGTQVIELRAKARLVIRTAARLPSITPLDERQAQAVLEAAAPGLAGETGAALDAVQALQEQLALLQLALDARTLRRVTLRQLRVGP